MSVRESAVGFYIGRRTGFGNSDDVAAADNLGRAPKPLLVFAAFKACQATTHPSKGGGPAGWLSPPRPVR